MTEWQWYDWQIFAYCLLALAVFALPFACWIFGWTIQ